MYEVIVNVSRGFGVFKFVLKMLEKYFLDISTVILNHKVFEIALERSLCIGIIIRAHD